MMLLLATEQGVWSVRAGDGAWRAGAAARLGRVTALAGGGEGPILAAAEDGVACCPGPGGPWEQAAPLPYDVLSVAISAADGAWYAGTEPSHLFRSRNAGETWEELEGLRHVPSREQWSFPPRPWTHYVSAIAPHAARADVVVAGIEAGGVMRTDDGGRTFADHARGAHADCHVLRAHPVAPGRVWQGAGEGTADSGDAGRTFSDSSRGLVGRYVTALTVDAVDPDLAWAGSAPSPGRAWYSGDADARVHRRRGDGAWECLNATGGGLPAQFTRAVAAMAAEPAREGGLVLALRDGTLLRSPDGGDSWRRPEIAGLPQGGFRRVYDMVVASA